MLFFVLAWVVRLVPSWAIAVSLHECCHVLAAHLLGWRGWPRIEFQPTSSRAAAICVLPGLKLLCMASHEAVRHAGWLGSVCIALVATYMNVGALLPFWWVAMGAVASDLLGMCNTLCSQSETAFACGNFGVLVFQATARTTVFQTLRKMARITMVRGAQSAGLVTYERSGGLRCRVVNGKRTDLADLLLTKMQRDIRGGVSGVAFPLPNETWRLFQVCRPCT